MRLHDVSSRTTLTLDDDVAARLAQEARARGVPYRTVVNEALRAGLERRREPPGAFQVRARPMGLRPGVALDDIEGLLDLLDDADRP